MATSANQEGVEGTDSGAIWIFTSDCVILGECPPYQERVVFFLLRRHMVAGLTTFFPLLSISVSTPLACSQLVAHLVGRALQERQRALALWGPAVCWA